MPKVDLKLYSTDAAEGKKITTSVTYVNPNASNAVLKTFAQQLNAFTTNTYSETDRVETINVDTDSSRKQFRNITITGATQGATATISAAIRAGGTITPAVFFLNTSSGSVSLLSTSSASSTDPTIAKFTVQIPNNNGVVYVGLMQDSNFYADFINATVS